MDTKKVLAIFLGIAVIGAIFLIYKPSKFETTYIENIENNKSSSNVSEKAEEIQEEAFWTNDGNGWTSTGNPPDCPEPLILESPVDINLATSIIYPGQIRGTDYKPHGGFRFDDRNSNDIEVKAVMDGYILKASRYETGDGETQSLLFYINECGIMIMNDHLLTLSPKLQEVFDKISIGKNGDSRTTNIEPKVYIEKGEILATEIGFKKNKNIFLDWGVYDLRKTNGVFYDSDFRSNHPNINEYGTHAVCWFDLLSPEENTKVRSLPPSDGVSKDTSDYCK